MKRPVVWSRAALDDLKGQTDYINRDDPAAARRLVARLREVGDELGGFATGHVGRVAESYEKSVSGLPYIVAYAINRATGPEQVVILRVIHTAREWRTGNWPD